MTVATSTNAGTVAEIYAAFGRGDLPAILDALAEDVAWEDWAADTAQRSGVPWMARRHGPNQVAEFFGIVGAWTLHEFRVLDIVGSGRQVAAEIAAEFSLPGGTRSRRRGDAPVDLRRRRARRPVPALRRHRQAHGGRPRRGHGLAPARVGPVEVEVCP